MFQLLSQIVGEELQEELFAMDKSIIYFFKISSASFSNSPIVDCN